MKREGRQHVNGISKTTTKIFPTPRSNSKPIINTPPPPTSSKQKHPHTHTHNRSKLIGKCGKSRCIGGGCHVCKSKDKAHKGTYKLRSCDVGLNHRLISWRVVDNKGLHQLNYVGVSATQVLDQLKNHYYDDIENDDDFEENDQSGVNGEDEDDDCEMNALVMRSVHVEDGVLGGANEEDDYYRDLVEEDEMVNGADEEEGEVVWEYEMGDFCDVGYFVIEQLDGDEDWCLVGEL